MTDPDITDATWVVGLLAVWGPKLGGVVVAQDVADDFNIALTKASGAIRTVSSSLNVEALTGTIDLAATLALGKPVLTAGLLAEHSRLWVRRAERLDTACASLMAQALDDHALMLVAVADLQGEEDSVAPKLSERMPFLVETLADQYWTSEDIALAKKALSHDDVDPKWVDQLCDVALSIGIASPRAVVQAVKAARGVAALKGLQTIDESSVALAGRLVLAHRAQHLPQPDQQEEPTQNPPEQPPETSDMTDAQKDAEPTPADADFILEAIKSALPEGLLQFAAGGLGQRGVSRNIKNAAQRKPGGLRGRRIGNKRASSLAGQRLDILATLRSAAPWQPLRRKLAGGMRMIVTRDDFRVARIKQRTEATAIFAVDASGSTAFQRLAEAKGAVETILAECYVRRDKVAMVAFRNRKAEVLLPPTRSLERAKRALAGLPGGGGTPLASGLDEAFELALQVRRSGGNPIVIVLTDGKGNVTRAGEGNKAKALEESQAAAKMFAAESFDALIIDVSPEPQKSAKFLANTMKATYLPMPRASATDIARPVRLALKAASA